MLFGGTADTDAAVGLVDQGAFLTQLEKDIPDGTATCSEACRHDRFAQRLIFGELVRQDFLPKTIGDLLPYGADGHLLLFSHG